MASLRQNIERIIASEPDPDRCAVRICLYIEDELNLSDNGWWDSDPVMKAQLGIDEEK